MQFIFIKIPLTLFKKTLKNNPKTEINKIKY